MPTSKSTTITATGTVASSATGTLSNTATVTAPAGVTDSPSTNNSASYTHKTTYNFFTSIEFRRLLFPSVAGTPDTYTIVVTNNGPSDVVNAAVSDKIGRASCRERVTFAVVGGRCGEK